MYIQSGYATRKVKNLGGGYPLPPRCPQTPPILELPPVWFQPWGGRTRPEEIRKGMDLTLGQRSCQDQGKRTSKPALPGSTNLYSSEGEDFNNGKTYSPLKKKDYSFLL